MKKKGKLVPLYRLSLKTPSNPPYHGEAMKEFSGFSHHSREILPLKKRAEIIPFLTKIEQKNPFSFPSKK